MNFAFEEEQFSSIFPFYILLDLDLIVEKSGVTLEKLLPETSGKKFRLNYAIKRPNIQVLSFRTLCSLVSQVVMIECKNSAKTILRGQFEYLSSSNKLLFLGSPWFGSIEEVIQNNLTLHDFAFHDPMIDLLHVLKTTEIVSEDLKKLLNTVNIQKNKLKKINEEIKLTALFPTQNPDPLIRINFSGDVLRKNPSAEKLKTFEYENRSFNFEELFKYISSQVDISQDRWIFEVSSGTKSFSFVCITMKDEGYINIYGRDITQQKIDQEELERLSLIVQETRNVVIVTDSKGRVEWTNKAFEEVTGYLLEEIKGKTPGSFLQGKNTDPDTVQYMKEQIAKAKPFTCEILNYKKSGQPYWLRVNAQPIFDKYGNISRFFAIEEDITFERHAQENLKAAAGRMSSLIKNLHAGILLENSDKSIALINLQFCKLFNIPADPAKLIGTDCSQAAEQSKHLFNNPESFMNRIQEVLQEQKLVIGDKLELRDGRYLERDYIPIWNDGIYDGHLWVYTDITDKINTEVKIVEQRIFYEEILDKIPADIAVFDNQHRYMYVNPMGIKDPVIRKWIIGKKDEQYISLRKKPKYILEERRKIFNSVLETKTLNSWEESIVQPDGSKRYVLRYMYPVTNHDGNVKLIIGYGVDITNIKNIQNQIEESEKRYRDVIDNSLALIFTHDLEGRFLTVNPMVGKIYGYSDTEMIGESIEKFIPESDKPFFVNNYLTKIKNEKNASGIFKVISKSGKIIYTLYNNYLKEDPGNDPYVIGFAVDITDRVKAEKELKVAKRVTEELAQAKQNFLANMSHEIRTPMNAIMGMTNQLSKTEMNEDQRFFLDTIQSASGNLLVIINDILDLSKIEEGKLAIEDIGLELKLIIERAMQVLSYKAEEKGLALTNSYYDLNISEVVIGDPYRLNQILLNLLSNSIKFTEKGFVDVNVRLIKSYNDQQTVEIIVSDSGIGMDEQFIKNLFNKFTQEEESFTRKFGGTGLGMSISKELVELMGGSMEVKSKKGEGTSVSFSVPFIKGTRDNLPKIETEKIDTNILSGKRVLVTDDNEMNRLVATTILKSYGAIIEEAQNGQEAIDKIRSINFDIVLMDVQMPVLDGIESAKIIRETISEKLPIIALTAYAIKGDNTKFLNAGMNDYLSKPFEEEQLLKVVAKCLGKPIYASKQSNQERNKVKLYDLSQLHSISKGNQEFVEKMISLFIDHGQSSVNEIISAYKKRDFKSVSRIAHRLKPSIDNMGISSLKNEIRELENSAENHGTSQRLDELIKRVEEVINEVVKHLKAA